MPYPESSVDHDIEKTIILDGAKSNNALLDAKRLRVSADIIFLSSYFKSLSQLCNHDEIIIGLFMNNRLEVSGGEKVFGLHLNILPIKTKINNNRDEFILSLSENRQQLIQHKSYPYAKLCRDLNCEDGFYSCAFNYTHFHINENNTDEKLIEPIYAFEKMSIPLTLQVSRYKNNFSLTIRASNKYIDEKTTENLLGLIQHNLQ